MIQILEEEIVPRLERDGPNQPTKEELEGEPLRHRFRLIFDRAGYSPGLFSRLKSKRIACLTYRRSPGEDWAEKEFSSKAATLSRKTAEFGALELAMDDKGESKTLDAQIQKRASRHEEIDGLAQQIVSLKLKRKTVPRHILMSDLPAGQKLERLSIGTRQLLDTVKMIAYRAETAMAQTKKENMWRKSPEIFSGRFTPTR